MSHTHPKSADGDVQIVNIFFGIVYNSIIPICIMIGLGFILEKAFHLDVNVLTKITIYLFVPAFAFVNIFTTDVSTELFRVILCHLLLMLTQFALVAALGRFLKRAQREIKSFQNALMFFNAGNIGVPLMTLAFSNEPFVVNGSTPYLEVALTVQIMALLVQNFSINTFGLINVASEKMTVKKAFSRVMKMPAPYAVCCAFLFKLLPFDLTVSPIWPALGYLRNGMVSVSLLTFGVQMAKSRIDYRETTPYIAAFCRLLGGPVIAFFLIKLFGFEGIMAQAFLISAGLPSAVNIVVLSIENGVNPDFAVQTVAISTLLSAVTTVFVIYAAHLLF